MKPYDEYTLELTMRSSVITPFQSDTIFGHICWALHHLKWDSCEDKLCEFFKAFDTSPQPPLLVSNGFPKGYLPKPILPGICQDQLDQIFPKGDRRVQGAYLIKSIKKCDLIKKKQLENLAVGPIDGAMLFDAIYQNHREYEEIFHRKNHVVQRNTVNRVFNTVTEGLYADQERFFKTASNQIEIYLKTYFFSEPEIKRIFEFISLQGFGKNKSSGKGAFTFKPNKGCSLPETKNPNAFMTLSSFIPKASDPTGGYYTLIHKFGKLSGSHKVALPETANHPFKKPLIMLSAGSVFKDAEFSLQKTYGSFIKNVHSKNSHIRQYAYAFPIGLQIKENDNGN